MLSENRTASRSPSESTRTDSVATGPTTRLVSRQSERSSITEEDEAENIPRAPPLPVTIRSPTKSSSSTSSSPTPTQSTLRPTVTTTTTTKPSNPAISVLRNTLRHDTPSNQNKSLRQNLTKITTPSTSKQTIPTTFGRVSARDIENESPIIVSSSYYQGAKPNQSIFEKIDTHGGGTSYLGSGTFNQLENCISKCLSQNQSHIDYTHHTTKYDYHPLHTTTHHHYPHRSSTRASVLEDYSYDGILEPHHHHHHHHHDRHSIDDFFHHHSRSHHYDAGYHTKSAAELSLDEIRQVNEALAKYGVPVFSQPNHPYNQYRPRPVGDIISACQQLLTDPALRAQNPGTQAVQHVWDNLHYHSPQTNIHGYASPAVQAVASHLFHPNQAPYDPVHSVASHLFNTPQQQQQPPYNNPPYNNPPYNNPPYNNPPYNNPPYNNPAPPPPSSGQSVLSRLFGGGGSAPQQQSNPVSPFGASFQQYPGNAPYTY